MRGAGLFRTGDVRRLFFGPLGGGDMVLFALDFFRWGGVFLPVGALFPPPPATAAATASPLHTLEWRQKLLIEIARSHREIV